MAFSFLLTKLHGRSEDVHRSLTKDIDEHLENENGVQMVAWALSCINFHFLQFRIKE